MTENNTLFQQGYLQGVGIKQVFDEQLNGYFNLTQAIKSGANIDWGKLDGRKAKCVHPEMGVLKHKLVRYQVCPQDVPGGWLRDGSMRDIWPTTMVSSWYGADKWALWVEGDVPIKLRTASELRLGSTFIGKTPLGTQMTFVVALERGTDNIIVFSIEPGDNYVFYADKVEVEEIYSGGFIEGEK